MIDILMPRLSDTMTEGAIATWHKKPGDSVAPGDLLVEIETDKALMEQEAYDTGILAEILVQEGENAAIGTPIARLDNGAGDKTVNVSAASAPTFVPDAEVTAAAPNVEMAAPARAAVVADEQPTRPAATPLVRRLARERSIDLTIVEGTGPGGRIVRADLDAVAGTPNTSFQAERTNPVPVMPSEEAVQVNTTDTREPHPVPFDAIRQALAARLTESSTTTPAFTATASADVVELLSLRAQINQASAETGVKISVNDLLVRAVALALRVHPGLNASYAADGRGQTIIHGRVHVGIAVASPAGLVVPVIRDADKAAVSAISTTARDLVAKATDRKLTAVEMSDGTFTISNLGMYGIEHFTAIINPPQGAILAVGAARDELTLVDDSVVARKRLRYTLTADHRIIDGALAAQFLATLTELLQNPLQIVA
ncbi:pyruvate dehydrogenase E2 component (dihydrolipoamide acetyltransferase) [Pseudarthrobacter sp. W1I19]|uniref:dihydrolipoamide acetyltransferase family protein n=1 Tax=Pseudarthrobacter sp. W1I19 TaxID=3042288 RepID=UPI0027816A36|nr:dihydrolipoamide acetyltransferase family protein [Pseudarthrobacter sp. W1I19]MDQ0925651.1 pyruvate dehydrogenase E2 component (dihydrolipoamide acetyltransferase) [Pseudarthrobacter sp. W1I19]